MNKILNEKLIKNIIQCNHCLSIIESKHNHDFKWCKCGAIAIDGGLNYTRRIGDIHNYTDLSEYEEE